MRLLGGGVALALLALAVGCDDDTGAADAAGLDAARRDSAPVDAASPDDAAAADMRPGDAAPPSDALPADAAALDAVPTDASPTDATPRDASLADASPADASPADAAPRDASPADASLADARPPDASPADASPADASPADASPADAAPPPGACAAPRSACQIDADCGQGTCRALPEAPGATCFCVAPRTFPRRGCGGGGGFPEACCNDADCPPDAQGRASWCIDFQVDYCGGAAPPDINTCRVDACLSDADCGADQACLPAGSFGLFAHRCVTAQCARDADCALRAGGECRPYISRCNVDGFYCSYADDPCRVDRDCPVDEHGWPQRCAPHRDGTGTDCVPDLPRP